METKYTVSPDAALCPNSLAAKTRRPTLPSCTSAKAPWPHGPSGRNADTHTCTFTSAPWQRCAGHALRFCGRPEAKAQRWTDQPAQSRGST